MDRDTRIKEAERILGVHFNDTGLLIEALTHPSYAAENPGVTGYDRLEFLGDSVMGFLVADRLFRDRPGQAEGVLTRLKIGAVAGETLSVVAEGLGLGEVILMGKGAARSGGRQRSSVLENCFEAVIGAVYMDQGLEPTREFVMRHLSPYLSGTPIPLADPKSALQELVQADGALPPSYRIASTTGPPHDRVFVAEAVINDRVVGTGTGASKKDAEKAAATNALVSLAPGLDV
ncbi:MAG: ribonuclease III [Coriobacteriia bacterium]|nr:ribonuclease III [Coriobacteriia bacterium]MBN2822757.1 ribonuclease III [Coriobacteriia bacterium]